ncbi:MAG: T9SS type A sorting domain-containing protein [Bacteroidales bacterium]|jgi:YD repeat-containing protein|nr:T9SS type A sorting domain-containing protein [Bacteroidales bacterium]
MRKKLILISIVLLTVISLQAQSVTYWYDSAGNRIERRTTATLRSSSETTSLEDAVILPEIKIYPNPTRGLMYIEVGDFDSGQQVDLLLTDVSGKIIFRQKAASSIVEIDLNGHPQGIYLLRVQREGEVSSYKIIKE